MPDWTRDDIGRLLKAVERIGAVLLLCTLAACGGGGRDATGPGLNVSGTYEGTQTVSTGTVMLRFTITQNSTLVNGTFTTGTQDFGSVSGTVTGTSFLVQSHSTPFGITCAYTGTITDRVQKISGALQCSNGEAGGFAVMRI